MCSSGAGECKRCWIEVPVARAYTQVISCVRQERRKAGGVGGKAGTERNRRRENGDKTVCRKADFIGRSYGIGPGGPSDAERRGVDVAENGETRRGGQGIDCRAGRQTRFRTGHN